MKILKACSIGLLSTLLLNAADAKTNATLMAVGDIMMHDGNIKAGYDKKTESYDFSSFFTEIKPILARGDFVIGNLETRLAGKGKHYIGGQNVKDYTGYPLFNSPEILAQNLKDAGFTLLTTANNHCLDREFEGIEKTNNNIEKAGLIQTGTYSTLEDSKKIRILEKNGIRIAVFSYTDTLNLNILSKDNEYAIDRLNLSKIKNDFRIAKNQNVDLIVCALHFGTEYDKTPSKPQKEIANEILKYGADIILGSHPHVLQPHEITKENKAIIYSAGNFFSNMLRKDADKGAIYEIGIQKDGKKTIITGINKIPTKVLSSGKNPPSFRIIPLEMLLAGPKL